MGKYGMTYSKEVLSRPAFAMPIPTFSSSAKQQTTTKLDQTARLVTASLLPQSSIITPALASLAHHCLCSVDSGLILNRSASPLQVRTLHSYSCLDESTATASLSATSRRRHHRRARQKIEEPIFSYLTSVLTVSSITDSLRSIERPWHNGYLGISCS